MFTKYYRYTYVIIKLTQSIISELLALEMLDYYAVLQVKPDASDEDIKKVNFTARKSLLQ